MMDMTVLPIIKKVFKEELQRLNSIKTYNIGEGVCLTPSLDEHKVYVTEEGEVDASLLKKLFENIHEICGEFCIIDIYVEGVDNGKLFVVRTREEIGKSRFNKLVESFK